GPTTPVPVSGSLEVKVNDWGSGAEYDVTLNLDGQYDWTVKVKLAPGATVGSFWSANKQEGNGYVIFTPVSWNKGPTATFGFIVNGPQGDKVEEITLEINGQVI
uniref:chitinase n=1 Tax=Pyrococcus furiosus TaxID=2261 RepID=UPI0000DACA9A|nr:Chain A, chitinase [Pyrococcus furiosus]2CZN_A Chain A, chitinase [Pyrococcus furiosus]